MRRPYHHGDLRESILSAAMAKIETDGLTTLSIRDLARECGVSPSAPQKHFATKHDLLTALALRGYEELGERVAALKLDLPIEKALTRFGKAYVSYVAEHPILLQLMYSRRSSEETQVLDDAARRAFAPLDSALSLARAEGEIVSNRKEVDTVVWVIMRGLGSSISSGAFGVGDDALVRRVVRSVLTGLRPR